MALVHIQTITASGSPSQISFTNIPQDATHLVMKATLAHSGSNSTGVTGQMTVNSNTGNVYKVSLMSSNTSSNAQQFYNNTNFTSNWRIGRIGNPPNNAYSFSGHEIIFLNYASSENKTIHIRSGRVDDGPYEFGAGGMNSTSAITSIQIFNDTSNMLDGSTVSLYKLYTE